MRVYLPSTLAALAPVLAVGQIGPAPVRGFAVTPALREWYASGDLEELEYVAMTQAARASLRLLHADPAAPRRRVVLVAELSDDLVMVRNGLDKPGQVEVTVPVLLADVVSGHVDDPVAADDIEAAAAALPAADAWRQRRPVRRGRCRGSRAALVRHSGTGVPAGLIPRLDCSCG